MILWGDLVNGIRSLHFDFLNQFELPVRVFSESFEFKSTEFPFPMPVPDGYGDWSPLHYPTSILEGLELHPVERLLLEGPLLPVQAIELKSESQVIEIYSAIFVLETEWLEKTRLITAEKKTFFEQMLHSQRIKTQTRAGLGRLKVVST